MSDFKEENQDSCSQNEFEAPIEPGGVSRRGVLNLGISAGLAVMLDSILAGCKTRGFNAASKGSAASPTFDRENMAQAMLTGSFMERWNDIGAPGFEDRYPSVKLKVHAQILKAVEFEHDLDVIKGDKLQSALRTFLILFRTRANPLALQEELMKEGVDVVYPGGKGVCMVLSHKLVTDVVLNPSSPLNNVQENVLQPDGSTASRRSLLFQLGAYRPEMSNLTRHYMLCDDDIARHDAEKAYQHEHGIKATDAKLVADICRDAANELVSRAMARGGNTIDIVQDVARWIPMKVVNSYFGLPCGDNAPEFQLENNAIPLFQEISYDKAGVRYIKVTEEIMYMWIANGFRSLFLNVGKDPVLRDAGRRSGAQLMYYIYMNVIRESNAKVGKETMLSRLAQKMKDPTNPFVQGANSTNRKLLDELRPIQKLADDGAENPLYGLCTNVAAYRTAAQLAGSVAGAGVTIEEAIARVFNVLLRPENKTHLDACIAISKAGADFRTYYSQLFPYYNEALRFEPQAELLPRTVAKKAKASLPVRKALTPEGFVSDKNVEIPGGTLTLTCLYAAMHDASVVSNPRQFVLGRPGNHYLHFGWSHPSNDDHEPKHEGNPTRPVSSQGNACLGRFIAPVEIVEAMRAVFEQAGPGMSYADDAKLAFQKYAPMRPGDSNFQLASHVFEPSRDEERKVGPGAYPAGLRVKLN